jgi:hypothetical protein
MALLTINGNTVSPEPSVYDIQVADITEASRNASGELIAELIATKRRLDLSWRYLTKAQYTAILGYFTSFFNTIVYHDPVTGATRSATMYVGDRRSGTFEYDSGANEIVGWKDVKFSLIEK